MEVHMWCYWRRWSVRRHQRWTQNINWYEDMNQYRRILINIQISIGTRDKIRLSDTDILQLTWYGDAIGDWRPYRRHQRWHYRRCYRRCYPKRYRRQSTWYRDIVRCGDINRYGDIDWYGDAIVRYGDIVWCWCCTDLIRIYQSVLRLYTSNDMEISFNRTRLVGYCRLVNLNNWKLDKFGL